MIKDERVTSVLAAAVLIIGTALLSACDGRYTASPVAPEAARSTPTGGGVTSTTVAALFSADAGGAAATPAPGVVRRREADVDAGTLRLDTLQPAGRVLLNLFRDTEYVAVFERIDTVPTGRAWVGAIDGVPGSEVTLAIGVDGVFSATISTPGALYSVVSTGAGRYAIAQVDLSSVPHPG